MMLEKLTMLILLLKDDGNDADVIFCVIKI